MNLPWLLWLPLSAACGPGDCTSMSAMSMVQTRLHLKPHPKPWEVYDYITANYHKAGVILTKKIHTAMFKILGAGEDVWANWNTHATTRLFLRAGMRRLLSSYSPMALMPLGRLILGVNHYWWQALFGTRYRWWHLSIAIIMKARKWGNWCPCWNYLF